jgi:cation diffusion facilitator family transporter
MASNSVRVIIVAFIMNMGIALAKFVGFLVTGSAAMLAEAVHSVADSSNQILLYLGIRRSSKGASEIHPFGYGMEQYIFAFLVAIIIFTLGGAFSLYEGIHKLLHPSETIDNVYVNVIILSIAILLEGYSSYVATQEFKKTKGEYGVFQFLRKSKDQVLVTVLFEDYAALLGLVLAAAGNLLYILTDMVIFDSLATILIGILLLAISGFLYKEAKSLLVGEAASQADQDLLVAAITSHPTVANVKELLTMHLSSNQILVNAHVKFKDNLTLLEVEDAIDEIEAIMVKSVPLVYKVFIEPHQREKVGDIRNITQKES